MIASRHHHAALQSAAQDRTSQPGRCADLLADGPVCRGLLYLPGFEQQLACVAQGFDAIRSVNRPAHSFDVELLSCGQSDWASIGRLPV